MTEDFVILGLIFASIAAMFLGWSDWVAIGACFYMGRKICNVA